MARLNIESSLDLSGFNKMEQRVNIIRNLIRLQGPVLKKGYREAIILGRNSIKASYLRHYKVRSGNMRKSFKYKAPRLNYNSKKPIEFTTFAKRPQGALYAILNKGTVERSYVTSKGNVKSTGRIKATNYEDSGIDSAMPKIKSIIDDTVQEAVRNSTTQHLTTRRSV